MAVLAGRQATFVVFLEIEVSVSIHIRNFVYIIVLLETCSTNPLRMVKGMVFLKRGRSTGEKPLRTVVHTDIEKPLKTNRAENYFVYAEKQNVVKKSFFF